MNIDKLKARFLKVYANVPLNVRTEVIFVLDKKPLSWNVAWLEIVEDTPFSKEILTGLDRLKII